MLFKTIAFALCLTLLHACGGASKKTETVIGKWNMHQVLNDNIDVSEEHNPAGNRYIDLQEDGTFESGGDPFGINTGTWTIDTENSMVHIHSDAENDDSDWSLELKNDEMIWKGIGDPGKERFKLIHKKSSK